MIQTSTLNGNSNNNALYTKMVAFGAGVLHGIAGPGGVLGVMIALKLNNWLGSSLYLLFFFIASIFTMAIYAGF